MIQLVSPNLSTKGTIGMCLDYARRAFGAAAVEANAWDAWRATGFKHADHNLPTDVSVPCWFSFVQNGVNLGHVVIWVPGQGFYSSPWQAGTDHAVLPSIAEVERLYGVVYVGWSEDISKVRVVKENDMLTPAQVDHVLKMGLRREPTADELNNPDFANNAGLLIDTVWNNGGQAFYSAPPAAADPNSVTVTKDSLWASFKKFLGL